MDEVQYALDKVQDDLMYTLATGYSSLLCQLVNQHRGFQPESIEAIKAALKNRTFPIPAHVSILPAGKATSDQYIFDGLVTIYCNSSQLELIVERTKKERYIKGKGGN